MYICIYIYVCVCDLIKIWEWNTTRWLEETAAQNLAFCKYVATFLLESSIRMIIIGTQDTHKPVPQFSIATATSITCSNSRASQLGKPCKWFFTFNTIPHHTLRHPELAVWTTIMAITGYGVLFTGWPWTPLDWLCHLAATRHPKDVGPEPHQLTP